MAAHCSTSGLTEERKLPVLLFDIMDTIVRDPFYHDVPSFFRMSMKELLETKHPTAWAEFEKGLIDEVTIGEMKEWKEKKGSRGFLSVVCVECQTTLHPMANVEAAVNAGMFGLHFRNAHTLEQELSSLGVEVVTLDNL
ncbi:putative Haloacid dehalogenase-like hydrolase superfamily protein isoform 2 [Cocos nucifera]|uniref:Putative Haloacid dehalogenase-like hydrolase superfamily protein isoform 2 n=1 Tax=Cocos nucifera TaxID=13894 RepID=A0A8K0HZR9_COCNU|nr:putative Haloacid dehalogenase-like hydrolase superfamily protein isoform 2 [Cocos nucifera]